jgi:serine/threonine-protein kinase HipA
MKRLAVYLNGERAGTLTEEDIVAELPRRPLMAGREGLRLSLAGSQPKLPVLIRDSAVALPLGGTPSTHILKPEPERFPGLAAVEVLCMETATPSRRSHRRIGGRWLRNPV